MNQKNSEQSKDVPYSFSSGPRDLEQLASLESLHRTEHFKQDERSKREIKIETIIETSLLIRTKVQPKQDDRECSGQNKNDSKDDSAIKRI